MRNRIITAVVAILVLIPFLIFSDTFMLVLLGCIVSCGCLFEILKCTDTLSKLYCSIPTFLVAIALPCLARATEETHNFFKYVFIIVFSYIFYLCSVSVFMSEKFKIDKACVVAVMTTYISFGATSIILLRDLEYGKYIYLLAFLIPWMSDTFAYFVGVNFGKHKLIPEVSPAKTLEGAIGGIVFASLSVALYGFVIGKIFDGVTPRYLALIIAGVIVSVISQCGDLIASLLKRRFNIKDYGKIFPGHGGMMDRFDSIIAVAPFLYMLCVLSSFFDYFF